MPQHYILRLDGRIAAVGCFNDVCGYLHGLGPEKSGRYIKRDGIADGTVTVHGVDYHYDLYPVGSAN